MKHRLEIEIITGPSAGKRYVFHKKSIVVGRGNRADLSLEEDRKVSRRHLRLVPKRGKRFELTDMSSRGTYAAGIPVVKDVFPMGTEICLGDSSIRVGINQHAHAPREVPHKHKARKIFAGTCFVVVALIAILIMMRPKEAPDSVLCLSVTNCVALINAGQLDAAITNLEKSISGPQSSIDQEYFDLFHFAVEQKKRWDGAESHEHSLRYDSAKDEWEMIRSGLPDEWMVLKGWILTNQIKRLEQRIKGHNGPT